MNEKLPKEKIARFDTLITCMRVAIKNSALYPPGHPSFDSSISALKAALDAWFVDEDRLELGVTADNILLHGELVKEESDIYREAAHYLHPRGIIALAFTRGIAVSEMSGLFALLKLDPESLSAKGGLAKNMPPSPHIIVKEVDYRSLLAGARSGGALDEKVMWQTLTSIGKGPGGGALPESKAEFVKDFLQDPKRSAHVLNNVYREALANLGGTSAAEDIKSVFKRIHAHFEARPEGDALDAKKDLAHVVAKLDPALVANLFGGESSSQGEADLADELFSGLPDQEIADFIVSLLQHEDIANENFLKLFNKISSKKDGSDDIALLVADKLFDKKLLGRDALSGLQRSLKEIFKTHPDNNFISQIYKVGVGALIDKDRDAGPGSESYSALVKAYTDYIREENVKKEKVRLILDILYNENDPAAFKRAADLLTDPLQEALAARHVDCLRDAFELFTEKLTPSQKENSVIRATSEEALEKMRSSQALAKLISFIQTSDGKTLEDLAYVFEKAKERAIDPLLDTFVSLSDNASRGKCASMLSAMGTSAAVTIRLKIERLIDDRSAPSAVSSLYKILKEVDARAAHAVAQKMISSDEPEVRLRALEGFLPETDAEKAMVLALYEKEKDPETKKNALAVIVKTADANTVARLFAGAARGANRYRVLKDLMTVCGDYKTKEAVPYLGKLLGRRPFFTTQESDSLRADAVINLGRIGTPEALDLVGKARNDRSAAVRTMCGIVLRAPEKNGEGRK